MPPRRKDAISLTVTAEPDGVRLWFNDRALVFSPDFALRLGEEIIFAASSLLRPHTFYYDPPGGIDVQ